MEIKVTIGFTAEAQTILESIAQSLSGVRSSNAAASKTKTAASSNGVDKTAAKTKGPETNDEVTIEQVRAAVQTKATAGKREDVKIILSQFNVAKVTELESSDYAPFLEKVNAL